jgi:hypothetical protein
MSITPVPDYPTNPYAVSGRVLEVSGSGEVALPELVRLPFNLGNLSISTTGAGGTGNASFSSALVGSNPDGSDTGISVNMPAIAIGSPPFNSCRIFVPFYGSTFGIRWRADSGVTATNIDVVVDGEAVGVDCTWPPGPYPTLSGFNVASNEAIAITHRNLPTTGLHMAEIIVNGPTSGGNTIVVLHGILVDRYAGYTELPRLTAIATAVALTTTAVEVDTSRTNAQQIARGIRRVYYINTSASPVIVDLQYNGVSFKRLYLAATGTAGDSQEWDPGMTLGPLVASGAFILLKHKASAVGVNATVQYAY